MDTRVAHDLEGSCGNPQIFYGVITLKLDKPFLTYDEQINRLIMDKGLSVPNRSYAVMLLKKHSYFGLISGYKAPFKKANSDKYMEGTRIEDILALYSFDDSLRFILLKYILIVEIHIKSLLAYAFTETFGEDQQFYLDVNNYDYSTTKNKNEIDKLVNKFRNLVSPPFDYKYLQHQYVFHHNIPLWVTVKALTLGNISKMYSLSQQKIRIQVSQDFDKLLEGDLSRMLDLLTRFRNVCAHNERLFNYKYINGSIPDNDVHAQLIGNIKPYNKGKSDLFASIICLKYLLDERDFFALVSDIELSLDILLGSTRILKLSDILRYMGFPPHWTDILSANKFITAASSEDK